MSKEIEALINPSDSVDLQIIKLVEEKENLQEQLSFWKPILMYSDPLYNYILNISYYAVFNKYELQKDIGIKHFIDFLICDFMRSDQFKKLDDLEKECIFTFLKGRLQ
jgi:hypothetical protein